MFTILTFSPSEFEKCTNRVLPLGYVHTGALDTRVIAHPPRVGRKTFPFELNGYIFETQAKIRSPALIGNPFNCAFFFIEFHYLSTKIIILSKNCLKPKTKTKQHVSLKNTGIIIKLL